MIRLIELKLPLEHNSEELQAAVLKRLDIGATELLETHIFRRGVDARSPEEIKFVYTLDLKLRHEGRILKKFRKDKQLLPTPDTRYQFVARAPEDLRERPLVVGLGPAGLILAQSGFRPLILERGRQVRERTKDTFALWRKSLLNPESNVQFGEGGAGTFSDGKLYTRISDSHHYGCKVLEEFVKASAPVPGIPCWVPPITSWCITPATAARSIASVCVRGERWWPPPLKLGAW